MALQGQRQARDREMAVLARSELESCLKDREAEMSKAREVKYEQDSRVLDLQMQWVNVIGQKSTVELKLDAETRQNQQTQRELMTYILQQQKTCKDKDEELDQLRAYVMGLETRLQLQLEACQMVDEDIFQCDDTSGKYGAHEWDKRRREAREEARLAILEFTA